MKYSEDLYNKNTTIKEDESFRVEDLEDKKPISIDIDFSRDRTKLDGGDFKEYYYGQSE